MVTLFIIYGIISINLAFLVLLEELWFVLPEIEFSESFSKAFNLLENSKESVFITGRAGTGKSTFLRYLKENSKKKIVLLAPTGVAALNIGGQTIHSFFRFPPGLSVRGAVKEAYKRKKKSIFFNVDLFVIDEISMVRADLLDCIDVYLKTILRSNLPFGGKQMLFIGDMCQLPPVVNNAEQPFFRSSYKSEYFFDSAVMKDFKYALVDFEKVYRQKDAGFIGVLNRVRDGTFSEKDLSDLNSRLLDGEGDDGTIHLTTTNAMADGLNSKRLAQLPGTQYNYRGVAEGKFKLDSLPADEVLGLKEGTQVMFLVNDAGRRWVNGTIGVVTGLSEQSVRVRIAGNEVNVVPHEWGLYNYKFDEHKGEISQELVGAFTQFPLRLAWAITIHKSQGKTFDNVIIDVGRGAFAHGQLYVALSRCRTLEGIRIKTPIRKEDVLVDGRVLTFVGNRPRGN